MEDQTHHHHTGLVVVVALVAIIAIMLMYFMNANQQAQSDLTGQAYASKAKIKLDSTEKKFSIDIIECYEKYEQGSSESNDCIDKVLDNPDYAGVNPERVMGWLQGLCDWDMLQQCLAGWGTPEDCYGTFCDYSWPW